MPCEIPVLRRCCFCIPLRIGMLVASYFKLILSLLTVLYILSVFYTIVYFIEEYFVLLYYAFYLLNSLMDISFNIILIIGVHKKEDSLLRICYRYSIYNIAANVFLAVFLAVSAYIFFISPYFTFAIVLFTLNILVQLYLMMLARSEVLKLKNNAQFQFVNNEAEARCSASIQSPDDLDRSDK